MLASGTERLTNDNTLITVGEGDRILEIGADGKDVREHAHPFHESAGEAVIAPTGVRF